MEAFTPIFPSPRYLPYDEIKARKDGSPDIDRRLFLLDIKLPEEEIQKFYPMLATYLEEGKSKGLPERYLCKHRTRWYSQEDRPPLQLSARTLDAATPGAGGLFDLSSTVREPQWRTCTWHFIRQPLWHVKWIETQSFYARSGAR